MGIKVRGVGKNVSSINKWGDDDLVLKSRLNFLKVMKKPCVVT